MKINVHQEIKINFESFTEHQLLSSHTFAVQGIDICGHRNLLASASYDHTVKLWNLKNNNLIKTYKYPGCVFDVVFSKQGNLLALGDLYGDLKLTDISDLNTDYPFLELKGHKSTVGRLKFSNDAKYLISGSEDKTVIVWDVIQTKQLFKLNSGEGAFGVAISGDNTILASISYYGRIKVWNFKNQNTLGGIWNRIFKESENVSFLWKLGQHKTVEPSRIQQSSQTIIDQEIQKIDNFYDWIWTVLFTSCSQFIIYNCNENTTVIDLETGVEVKSFQSNATTGSAYMQVAISQDMDIIAYGENKNIVIWRQK